MLSGSLPFEAESAVIVAMMQLQNDPRPLREINPTIPLGLAQITMNAMQKDVLRRYQSAAEMLCDLEAFRRDPSATFEHNYYIDDAPTRFVPTNNTNEEKPEKATKTQTRSWVPIATGVMVGVAILVAVILVITFMNKFNKSSQAKECPNFVGLTVNEIKEQYNPEEYTFEIKYEETDTYPVGEVIRQNPNPGTSIKKRNAIKLTIATEAELIKVPDVSNDTESLAKQTLKSAGFSEIIIEPIYDDVVNEGKVVKTSPLAGSQISADETITMYISKGKEILYTIVPDVNGYDEESAKAMIESKKLKFGTVTESPSSKPKGYVISQSIEEGTKVAEGSTVNIVISSGLSTTSYSMNISIDLPEDCSLSSGMLIAKLSSGGEYESPMLSFEDGQTYSFTITSENVKDTLTIKIADENYEYDYKKLAVNFSKQTYEITTNYDDYPKAQ